MNFHGRPHWSNTEYCHNNWPPQWVLNSNKHIYKTQTSFMCIGICWFIADSQSKSCVDLPLCPDLGYQAQRNLFMSAQLLINHTDESEMQIRIKINSDWSDYRNPKKLDNRTSQQVSTLTNKVQSGRSFRLQHCYSEKYDKARVWLIVRPGLLPVPDLHSGGDILPITTSIQ